MRLLLLFLFSSSLVDAQPYSTLATLTHQDVNRDGFEDVLLQGFKGVSLNNKTALNHYLLLGGRKGLVQANADSLLHRDPISGEVNFYCCYLNQDQFPDSISIKEPMLHIFYGSAAGFTELPDQSYKVELPSRKDWKVYLFDYNGDSLTDLILHSFGYAPGRNGNMFPINFNTYIIFNSAAGFTGGLMEVSELRDKDIKVYYNNDVNGDGRKDLALTYANNSMMIWVSRPNAEPVKQFLSKQLSGLHYGNSFFLHTDQNGDGKTDLLVLKKNKNRQFGLLTYTGTENGIGEDVLFEYELPDFKQGPLVQPIGDFDGNGFGDILVWQESSFWKRKYEKGMIIWGGTPLETKDTAGARRLMQFVCDENLLLASLGDVNGDKKTDLGVYHRDRLFVVYGNGDRKMKWDQISLSK